MDVPLIDGVGYAVGAGAAALAMYLLVIAATRLNGLRSLAQLSAFDLVMTVSIGTVVASTALSRTIPLADGLGAVVALFGAQALLSGLRRHGAQRIVDNRPLVLMVGDEPDPRALGRARMTQEDLWSKLREQGVRDVGDVGVVVLERTGSVSVLPRADDGSVSVSPELLEGVRGRESVPGVR